MAEAMGIVGIRAHVRWSWARPDFSNAHDQGRYSAYKWTILKFKSFFPMALLSIQIDDFKFWELFPMMLNGQPAGICWVSQGKIKSHRAFWKTECSPSVRVLFFLYFVNVPPNRLGVSADFFLSEVGQFSRFWENWLFQFLIYFFKISYPGWFLVRIVGFQVGRFSPKWDEVQMQNGTRVWFGEGEFWFSIFNCNSFF
jgi:hypothetical protein